MITLEALESLMHTHHIISPSQVVIDPSDSLESLGMDSLDIVELSMHVDCETGKNTKPATELTWKTVADVLNHYQ